jgi:Mrp family chromosome partitioning ATPase/uncharacterized protein involved in exopolysaccharide biosynthesis
LPNESNDTVLSAAWQYRWLVLAFTVVFTALSILVFEFRAPRVDATASVVVEDPAVSASLLTEARGATSDRFVVNQLEVFRSTQVARRAVEIAALRGVTVDIDSVLTDATYRAVPDSDIITISFVGTSAEQAREVVDSIIEAFEQIRGEQQRRSTDLILDRLSSAEQSVAAELAGVRDQIDQQRAVRNLGVQIDDLLNQISAVEAQLAIATSETARETLNTRRGELSSRLETLRAAFEAESDGSLLTNLTLQESELATRLEEILVRKSEVEIELQTARPIVSFASEPATLGGEGTTERVLTAAAGAILGALIAMGIAYQLAVRRRTFADRLEPETVLGVPFLADIPRFEDAGTTSTLPVRDAPRSPVAEAFRFAASGLELRMERTGARTVVAISASVGDGKSTIVANTALAMGRAGERVLVLDTDFGNQAVSQLLLGDIRLGPGLPELLTGDARIEEAVSQVVLTGDVTVDLIGRGTRPVVAPDFFGDRHLPELMDRLAERYDRIIIDAPPLMQVAYASSVARLAEAAVVVVAHTASFHTAEELRNRLQLLEANVIGYIYNRAPLRMEMMESAGSMKDVLGDRGFEREVSRRRRG